MKFVANAFQIVRAAMRRMGAGFVLGMLGLLQSQLGDAQQALEHFAAAEAMYRELGDRARQAIALNNLSREYAGLGEEERALDLLLQALPLQRQTGTRRGEGGGPGSGRPARGPEGAAAGTKPQEQVA